MTGSPITVPLTTGGASAYIRRHSGHEAAAARRIISVWASGESQVSQVPSLLQVWLSIQVIPA